MMIIYSKYIIEEPERKWFIETVNFVAVIAVDYPHLHGHFVHNKQVIILTPPLRRLSSLLIPLLVVANVAVLPKSLELCFSQLSS